MCQVLRHQSRLSHRRRRPPPPPLFPSWPSRIQWGWRWRGGGGGGGRGGGWLWEPKNVAVGFLQLLMFGFQVAPTPFRPFKTPDRMCVKTHSPANGYSGKEKKKEGGGGGARVATPPLRVTSCLSLQNREEEDSAPPSAAALILGGLSLSGGRGGCDGFKDRRPVGRVARGGSSEPCCCFGPRFVSSERSF